MASDLVASLRPWPIEDVVLGDVTYRVAALPAADWLAILLPENISLWAIVPELLEPDATEHFEDLIVSGAFGHADWEQLCWELVAIAAGRPWWTALYLLGNAKHHSHVEIVKGQLALHAVDATRISLASWLDAVYGIFTRNMAPPDRQKFDIALNRPPRGVNVKSDPAAQRAAFRQLMSSG